MTCLGCDRRRSEGVSFAVHALRQPRGELETFGWLNLMSPDRFCNSYLLSDQLWLDCGMIVVGISLSITWVIPVFFGEFSTEPERAS